MDKLKSLRNIGVSQASSLRDNPNYRAEDLWKDWAWMATGDYSETQCFEAFKEGFEHTKAYLGSKLTPNLTTNETLHTIGKNLFWQDQVSHSVVGNMADIKRRVAVWLYACCPNTASNHIDTAASHYHKEMETFYKQHISTLTYDQMAEAINTRS